MLHTQDAPAQAGRKQRVILDAARKVFLDHGYSAASMDEVAAMAAVSKVTVYKHFTDKERLFAAVVNDAIRDAEESTRASVEHLGSSQDVRTDLLAFARQHVVDVLQPHLLQLRRTVLAESARFPSLALGWRRAGPERGHAALAAQIARLVERGLLRAPDPLLAAEHLNHLIISIPLDEAMFTGRAPGNRRLRRYADEGVRVFLAAYGNPVAQQS